MNIERKLKAIEKEANRIIHKEWKEMTYVVCNSIEISFSIKIYDAEFRAGAIDADTKHVHRQVVVNQYLDFDLYSVKQIAAILAEKIIIKFEENE